MSENKSTTLNAVLGACYAFFQSAIANISIVELVVNAVIGTTVSFIVSRLLSTATNRLNIQPVARVARKVNRYSWSWKNIAYMWSTAPAFIITIVLFLMVKNGYATWEQVSPLFLIVIPLLFHGKKKPTEPGSQQAGSETPLQ